MAPKLRKTVGAVLFALGLCLLGFTLFGSIAELVAEESFESSLEPLLAIWWLLIPAGVVLTAVGAFLLFGRRKRSALASTDPPSVSPQEPHPS